MPGQLVRLVIQLGVDAALAKLGRDCVSLCPALIGGDDHQDIRRGFRAGLQEILGDELGENPCQADAGQIASDVGAGQVLVPATGADAAVAGPVASEARPDKRTANLAVITSRNLHLLDLLLLLWLVHVAGLAHLLDFANQRPSRKRKYLLLHVVLALTGQPR